METLDHSDQESARHFNIVMASLLVREGTDNAQTNINQGFAQDLVNDIKAAAEGEKDIEFDDADDVGQCINTILGSAAGMIPGLGDVLELLSSLLGLVIFKPLTIQEIRDALKQRIEDLIDEKIEDFHLESLRQWLKGLGRNLAHERQLIKDYYAAIEKNDEDKETAAETLRFHHVSLLQNFNLTIGQFQHQKYRAAELPLFAIAANAHLTVLADGIKRGKEWGFSDRTIQTWREDFTSLTTPKVPTQSKSLGKVRSGKRKTVKHPKLGRNHLEAGVGGIGSADLITPPDEDGGGFVVGRPGGDEGGGIHLIPNPDDDDDDGGIHAILHPDDDDDDDNATFNPSRDEDLEGLDYVSYVKRVYERGRERVKPYPDDTYDKPGNYPGGIEAGRLRAYAAYDKHMIVHVLNYAELWPFLTGEQPVTETTRSNLDREIFFGPYGRYKKYLGDVEDEKHENHTASWSASSPPLVVVPRPAPITGVCVRSYDDIDGLAVGYGGEEDYEKHHMQGSATGGTPYSLNLKEDEYITRVEGKYGEKLGQLTFFTDKKDQGWQNGGARHVSVFFEATPPRGYELTSIYITGHTAKVPPGCEGIILGFRPLITDTSRNSKTALSG